MNIKWKFIFQIFFTFLKISPVTFGGGYVMIPLIEREVVEKRKWVKSHELTEVFSIAESIPGAIAINSATFIGYRLAGMVGAITAMLGVLLPTFLIIIALSILFIYVQNNSYVEAAFTGIRASIVALITFAAIKIGKTAIYDKTTWIITLATVIILLFLQVHPILVILSGIILGIFIVKIRDHFGFITRLENDISDVKEEVK